MGDMIVDEIYQMMAVEMVTQLDVAYPSAMSVFVFGSEKVHT